MRHILIGLVLIAVGIIPLLAEPIGLTIPDTSFIRGSTVYLPVRVDSSLTGLDVTSYELQISFYTGYVIVDSAISTGTLTAGWGNPTFHVVAGKITIAAASTTALSGSGTLVYLKLKIPSGSDASYSYFQFTKAMLNEGTPSTITRNGNIYFANLPSITVYPDNALLAIGEKQQFNAYGGTEPYTWSSSDTAVASINSDGLLTAARTGFCKVVGRDDSGIVDTTSSIEVRAFKLSLRDTMHWQGQTFLVPVYISDLSKCDIVSGSFSLSYDANILTALGVEKSGSLLASVSNVAADTVSGKITVGFASDSRINGIGTQPLIFIRFLVSAVNTYSTWVQFSQFVFNETLAGIGSNGYFTPSVLATLTVNSPAYELVVGDTLQFSAWGAITPPLTWSVTDTSLASISSAGVLQAKKGGTIRVNVVDMIGARGQSDVVTLFDARLAVPDTSAVRGFTIELPLNIEGSISGLYAIQFTVSFDQTYFTSDGYLSTGTLLGSGGWSVSGHSQAPGLYNIAAAGSSPLTGSGALIKLRFGISGSTSPGNYAVTLSNILCNEGYPTLSTSGGLVNVTIYIPPAPVITTPANGSLIGTTTPMFSGTAVANSTIRLYVDDVVIDSTTADGSGTWSKVSAALNQGSHTIKVTATDTGGNTSAFSDINTFTIDTIAPNTPLVTAPINNSYATTATPTFSGTAEANSKVRIYIDGSFVDSTTANGSGNWSKVSSTLTQGSHTVRVTATDAAGNTSGYSTLNMFTVDSIAPNASVVTAPANGSYVTTRTPTMSGTAEANSKIRIYIDGSFDDTTTADGSGNWSKVKSALNEGVHTIRVTATDAAGNTSGYSNMNTFTVDSFVPSAPLVATPANNSTITTTTPTFSGTAEANSKVRIYVDGSLVDSTTANGSGNWSKISTALTQGSHTVKATATDVAGNTSGYSNINTFTVDSIAPNVPVVVAPANGSTVTTTTPTFSGTAEASSKVRLYVDGSLVDSTTADGSGNWSKVSSALTQGSHTIKATATDGVGNTSGYSNMNTFTVDSVVPNAPVVIAPANGSYVRTATPTLNGTADANYKVRIYIDGTLVDSTTADSSGNWSKVSPTLSQGSHTIKATATNASGTTSGYSNINTFIVDTIAPDAPVVVAPANGSMVTTTTPTFSGTAEANSKYRLYVDDLLADSAIADGSGNWSKVSATLVLGSHTIKATSTDAAGNTSSYSAANTFTVDTAATAQITVEANWNMLSLPLRMTEYRKTILFPTATSYAFDYSNGYRIRDSLAAGFGYWIKFTSGSSWQVSGTTIAIETLDVANQWNIIGCPSSPVPISNIVPVGTAIASYYFGFSISTGYQITTTLQPGKGYWIKVNGTGQLILHPGSFAKQQVYEQEQTSGTKLDLSMVNSPELLEGMKQLTFKDARGQERTLWFSTTRPFLDTSFFELPPLPPSTFDARFESKNSLAVFGTGNGNAQDYSIALTGAEYPVTVTWEASSDVSLSIDNQEATCGTFLLSNAGSKIQLKFHAASLSELPNTFGLSQNYPNPFNPATVIRFYIPSVAAIHESPLHVTLKVYNMLGMEVATLVEGIQDAGYKSVGFDANKLPSGIYTYRLTAGGYVETKRMVFIK